jgi:hypothetical protein
VPDEESNQQPEPLSTEQPDSNVSTSSICIFMPSSFGDVCPNYVYLDSRNH